MRASDAFFYIICHTSDDGADTGPCKIGVTANLSVRLSTLQTGNHHRLKVYAHLHAPREIAQCLETGLMSREETRLIGEWFAESPEKLFATAKFWLYLSMRHFADADHAFAKEVMENNFRLGGPTSRRGAR